MSRSANSSPTAPGLLPRQHEIVQLAKQHGFVTVDVLAERLNVTTQTIRRDINFLCEQGALSRFHGGAAFRSSIANLPYETRRDSLMQEKTRIARHVAAEIEDSASIFLDIGTTAEAVAMQLVNKRNMRVVTNNLNIVDILSASEGVEITVTGGSVRGSDRALVGSAVAGFIRQFHLDYAILGVVAISEDCDILDFFIEEETVTQAILGCARHPYIVADHSKFGRKAMVKAGHLSQAEALFTDALPDDEAWVSRLAETGTRLVVAKAAPH